MHSTQNYEASNLYCIKKRSFEILKRPLLDFIFNQLLFLVDIVNGIDGFCV